MELGKNAVFVILLVAFLAIGAYVYINTGFAKQTISVTGNSEVTSQPDLASVYITIETTNKSADDSKNANAEISSKVVSALKAIGFKDSDIATSQFNIYPDYSWNGNSQVLNGYKTSNSLRVNITDFNVIGKVVDAGVDSGGNIASINFELSSSKQNELKADALKKATADAQNQAQAVADGAGKRLGRLVSITTQPDYRYYPMVAYANAGSSGADAKSAATSITPQDLTVSATVQAVYAI